MGTVPVATPATIMDTIAASITIASIIIASIGLSITFISFL